MPRGWRRGLLTRMGETRHPVRAPTTTTRIMAAPKDMQRGRTTGCDYRTEGYGASDAKGWVTLHRSAREKTQGKRRPHRSPP